MPIIAEFKGMKVFMNYSLNEHNPPHVHGVYGSKRCTIALDGTILERGGFPKVLLTDLVKFVKEHQNELSNMWNEQKFQRIV